MVEDWYELLCCDTAPCGSAIDRTPRRCTANPPLKGFIPDSIVDGEVSRSAIFYRAAPACYTLVKLAGGQMKRCLPTRHRETHHIFRMGCRSGLVLGFYQIYMGRPATHEMILLTVFPLWDLK